MDFVDLDRRFRDLTEKELEDPAFLAFWADRDPPFAASWDQLLESDRVILLAEAGSGKTREMKAQVERMVHQGKSAYFIPIEVLGSENFRDYLSAEEGEAERFDAWQSGTDIGWFFLDAVDELKLRQGRLDSALAKLSRAVGKGREPTAYHARKK